MLITVKLVLLIQRREPFNRRKKTPNTEKQGRMSKFVFTLYTDLAVGNGEPH